MPVLTAPVYLVAALAASLVVVALHLLAWRRPRPTPLPTARFAPPSAVRALSRDLRLSDALLMMMRVAALLLAGLALARPVVQPRRVGVARVIVVDASRRVSSIAEARDSARARAGGADAVSWIRVDSSPAIVSDSALGQRAEVRGRLGSGMVAAIREGTRLAETHQQVSIVVVSPFAAESWDAGMEAMRAAWRGEVVAVRVGARATGAGEGAVPAPAAGGANAPELPPPSDPLGAAFALALDRSAPAIRVRRELPTAGDSAWVREGGILVSWPRGQSADSGSAREAAPEVLTSGGRSVAGRFGRSATGVPSGVPSGVPAGSVILRWGDGAAAAVEQPMGRGCIRSVGVALPDAGDEVLRPGFLRLLRELAHVCGGGSAAVLDSGTIARWARPVATGAEAPLLTAAGAAGAADIAGAASAERSAARAPSASERALQRWLLLAVAALLLAEWVMRRWRSVDARRVDRIAPPQPREAA